MNDNIRGFDSFEDAMAFMETNRMEMSESALPEQWALADGNTHYYLSIQPSVLDGQPTIIMGEIFSQETWDELEGKYYNMDNEEEATEFGWSRERVIENRKRGLVYVKAFSIIEPQGEYGTTHIAACAPATKEAFDEFMNASCRVTTPLMQPHLHGVLLHIVERRRQGRQG